MNEPICIYLKNTLVRHLHTKNSRYLDLDFFGFYGGYCEQLVSKYSLELF